MADRLVLNLRDSHFAHDVGCVAGVEPARLQWNRGVADPTAATVFSHEAMLSPEVLTLPREQRIGFLLESQSIIPKTYQAVDAVMSDFAAVFTHSSQLLERHANAHWIPGGGVWIGGRVGGGSIGIASKSRNISMLSSWKRSASLHRKRLAYSLALYASGSPVDVFLPTARKRIPVNETLTPYRYSIIVENYVDDLYFTEKLLNCFATGTVPIYLGARNLSSVFDMGGVITFEDWGSLRSSLAGCDEADYESRIEAIEENLRRVRGFRCVEDYLVDHYRDLLGGPQAA